MNSFYLGIYEIVSKIPEGKVATYGQIAAMLGSPRGARTVGWAMGCAPYGLPCHRVVNKLGCLAPDHVFGSVDNQRARLEDEGITFLANGCIDMDMHLWKPE